MTTLMLFAAMAKVQAKSQVSGVLIYLIKILLSNVLSSFDDESQTILESNFKNG